MSKGKMADCFVVGGWIAAGFVQRGQTKPPRFSRGSEPGVRISDSHRLPPSVCPPVAALRRVHPIPQARATVGVQAQTVSHTRKLPPQGVGGYRPGLVRR
eukprot:9475301-Pyramimonas_sp.AAC.1